MRFVVAISLIAILSACTTARELQSVCAAENERFVDEISCLSQMIEQEPQLKNDSFVSEYILSGKVLARKVQAGKIKEDEARLQLARNYNRMRIEQQRLNTLSAIELDALSPRYHDCDFDPHTGHARCYEW